MGLVGIWVEWGKGKGEREREDWMREFKEFGLFGDFNVGLREKFLICKDLFDAKIGRLDRFI